MELSLRRFSIDNGHTESCYIERTDENKWVAKACDSMRSMKFSLTWEYSARHYEFDTGDVLTGVIYVPMVGIEGNIPCFSIRRIGMCVDQVFASKDILAYIKIGDLMRTFPEFFNYRKVDYGFVLPKYLTRELPRLKRWTPANHNVFSRPTRRIILSLVILGERSLLDYTDKY